MRDPGNEVDRDVGPLITFCSMWLILLNNHKRGGIPHSSKRVAMLNAIKTCNYTELQSAIPSTIAKCHFARCSEKNKLRVLSPKPECVHVSKVATSNVGY